MNMQPKFSHLTAVDNNRPICDSRDADFWKRLQSGLLLALKEQGRLSGLQYQYAREQLNLSSDDILEEKI